jgi:hypothetical protein
MAKKIPSVLDPPAETASSGYPGYDPATGQPYYPSYQYPGYGQTQQQGPEWPQPPQTPEMPPAAPDPAQPASFAAGPAPMSFTPPVTPNAIRATHFYGPVCSGNIGLVQVGEAPLLRRFDFGAPDVTGFQVTFPPGSVLYNVITQVNTLFNGTTPALHVGTTAAGAELASVTLGAAGTVSTTPVAVALPANGIVYLSTAGASTAGQGHVMLVYAGRPAAKFS